MLLSVITRCNRRPRGLYNNMESIHTQTYRAIDHVILWDGQNRGIKWASEQLFIQGHKAMGDYVMVLDDDDQFAHSGAVQMIVDAAEQLPDMILWRMDHGEPLGVLPDSMTWEKRPVEAHIGMSCWAVRHDVWMANLHRWVAAYEADFLWLNAIWDEVPEKIWIDAVLTKCQTGRSIGETEF